MSLTDDLLSLPWPWLVHGLFALALLAAVFSADWSRFRERRHLHLFMGSCVLLLLLWNLNAGIRPGLNFHFLGATIMTLMFGWQMALVGMSLVLLGGTFNGLGGWENFSLNGLLFVFVPVMASQLMYLVVEYKLPRNYFIYVLAGGFVGGGMAAAASSLSLVTVLAVSETYSMEQLAYEYLPFLPLMIFPEGFVNGFLTAVMAMLRPSWLLTFDCRGCFGLDKSDLE
jgi:uncharacterized membrane protein